MAEYIEEAVGVPLLHMSHKAMVLNPPSAKSKKKAAKFEQEKIQPADYQFETLKRLKTEVFGPQEEVKKKKKKLKGPNPLSCKKKSAVKKNNVVSGQTETKSPESEQPKKKRVRKRKRKIPEHVKVALNSSSQAT